MSFESAARFSGLAALYDRYRPSYPPAAIEYVLEGLPLAPTVIDIGAGTGISTAALATAGAHAIAIEPNEEMRAAAAARGLDARGGTAAQTGLADRCADAVTCFQSFHWFAHDAALHEFKRLLRPGGRVALIWNERERNDPFTAESRELEHRFGERATLDAIREAPVAPLLREAGFDIVRERAFANHQILDAEGLIGRVRSTSYAPRSGDDLLRLLESLHELHARYADSAGTVMLRYATEVTIGEFVTA